MKKHSIVKVLLSSFLILSINCLLAQAPILASDVSIPTAVKDKPDNEREVLQAINRYIAEHLEDIPEFMSYYNTDLAFTLSLQISAEGIIEQVTSSTNCQHPIASALMLELEKLEKVEPIVKNGIPVERQYHIPIRLQAR